MNRALLVLFLSFLSVSAYAQDSSNVDFTFTVDHASADESTGTIQAHVAIINKAAVPLQQIEILLNRGEAEPVVTDPSWTCGPWSGGLATISCRHATDLAPQSQLTLDFLIRFPLRAGRHLQGAALVAHYTQVSRFSIHKQIATVMFKSFVVRNANDSGTGSLRDAITGMNGDPVCVTHPCRVTFAMEGQTIHLLSPLPRITVRDVEIDGTTQPDTNPLGPDVEILGAGLHEGNGLELDSRIAAVRGLAIGYFPGNGLVHVAGNEWSEIVIEKNYIGVDATGSQPRINLGRGIVLTPGDVRATIRDNVISGNYRSGIFVDTVRSRGFSLDKVIRITGNRIGVDAHGEWPIPNGASGVFVGPRADQVLVENNVIAYNKHFGVSVSREAVFVSVLRNRMFANALLGVDIALDGPSPVLTDGFNPVPTLLTAKYDTASNTTTITGRGSGPGTHSFRTFRYELYASTSVDADGYAETEQVLGIAVAEDNGTFSLTAQGDLRGKYISAVGIRISNFDGSLLEDTSEISRAIRVE